MSEMNVITSLSNRLSIDITEESFDEDEEESEYQPSFNISIGYCVTLFPLNICDTGNI